VEFEHGQDMTEHVSVREVEAMECGLQDKLDAVWVITRARTRPQSTTMIETVVIHQETANNQGYL